MTAFRIRYHLPGYSVVNDWSPIHQPAWEVTHIELPEGSTVDDARRAFQIRYGGTIRSCEELI